MLDNLITDGDKSEGNRKEVLQKDEASHQRENVKENGIKKGCIYSQ